MPDTPNAETRQESVLGMSDSAGKAGPLGASTPRSDSEAAAPGREMAPADILLLPLRQSEAILRSWEAAMHVGLDGFAAWASNRAIVAEGCQELLQTTINAGQQATKMMAQTTAQLFGMGASLVDRAAEPLTGAKDAAR